MSFFNRVIPRSGCGRAGIGLWLAAGVLALLLAWLTSGSTPPGADIADRTAVAGTLESPPSSQGTRR